jgi:hypothetical protein
MLRAFFPRVPAVVLALSSAAALASPEIQPGDALGPDDLAPEAQRPESALRGERMGAGDNSVDERRRFNARLAQVGLGTGLGMPAALLGGYAELNPWDRFAIGAEAGLTLWGAAGGAYVRLRPFIWGGEGRRLLNAFVLQASYTIMRHGELDLMPCISSPCREVGYLNRTAQFGALSAGFEHQLASGWSIRYEFGVGRALFATAWKCARYDDGTRVPCQYGAPTDQLPVLSFAVGHTL